MRWPWLWTVGALCAICGIILWPAVHKALAQDGWVSVEEPEWEN